MQFRRRRAPSAFHIFNFFFLRHIKLFLSTVTRLYVTVYRHTYEQCQLGGHCCFFLCFWSGKTEEKKPNKRNRGNVMVLSNNTSTAGAPVRPLRSRRPPGLVILFFKYLCLTPCACLQQCITIIRKQLSLGPFGRGFFTKLLCTVPAGTAVWRFAADCRCPGYVIFLN